MVRIRVPIFLVNSLSSDHRCTAVVAKRSSVNLTFHMCLSRPAVLRGSLVVVNPLKDDFATSLPDGTLPAAGSCMIEPLTGKVVPIQLSWPLEECVDLSSRAACCLRLLVGVVVLVQRHLYGPYLDYKGVCAWRVR